MKRFLRNSVLFLAGLLGVGFFVDARVGRVIRKSYGKYGTRLVVGFDVYQAVKRSDVPGPQVRVLYLGDSVSRQLFGYKTEPGPRVRYLCSNQAVSLAGQYYLLGRALKSCPNTREVDFFYFPGSWANNLPRLLSHDYYCGYFHTPGEIAETFAATRDFDLLAAQAGRCVFPNLLTANSASRPFSLGPAAAVAPTRRGRGRLGRRLCPAAGRPRALVDGTDAGVPRLPRAAAPVGTG